MPDKIGPAWDARLAAGHLAGPLLLSIVSWVMAAFVAARLYSSGAPAGLALCLGLLVLALPAMLWLFWQLKEKP